ncbi:MAG: hypothetical protein ACTXOO_02620 [Sodalis sp. (in: enterobacteria)]
MSENYGLKKCYVFARAADFTDEKAITKNMSGSKSYSRRGQRYRRDIMNVCYRETTKPIDGMRLSRLSLIKLCDRGINRHSRLAYIEKIFIPKLIKENVVVMDNLADYEVDCVREPIKAREF